MSLDEESLRRRAIMSALAIVGPMTGEALLGWLLYGGSEVDWARMEMFRVARTLAALEAERTIEVVGRAHDQEHVYQLTFQTDREWVTDVLSEKNAPPGDH